VLFRSLLQKDVAESTVLVVQGVGVDLLVLVASL